MVKEIDYTGKRIGKYQVERLLSNRGGFARVYLGRHISLENNCVAIKILRIGKDSEEERMRFVNEAHLLDKLRHPFILPILDLDEKKPYMVTEYATNGSLADRLKGPPLRIDEAINILSQIGSALQYAHEQKPEAIVHRDIKPDNILFNAQGRALLADFNIAFTLKDGITKSVAPIEGSFPYMPPEQFAGNASMKSDQYALACVAYELFTGHKPFAIPRDADDQIMAWCNQHKNVEPPPLKQYKEIPVHIEQAIFKAMTKDREQRHGNITAFLKALGVSVSPDMAPIIEINTPRSQDINNGTKILPNPDVPSTKIITKVLSSDSNMTQIEKATNHLSPDPDMTQTEKATNHLSPSSSPGTVSDAHTTEEKIKQKLDEGKILFERGRYDEALTVFEEVTKLNPKAEAHYWFGEIHYRMGNILPKNKDNSYEAIAYYNKAIANYEKAIHFDSRLVDSKLARVYIGMGDIYFGTLEKPDEAFLYYQKSTSVDPRLALGYYKMGEALTHNKEEKYDQALGVYKSAIKYDPDFHDPAPRGVSPPNTDSHSLDFLTAHYKIIALLQHSNDNQGIIATYNLIIQRKPDLPDAYYKKAALLEQLKNHKEEALATYDQIINHKPTVLFDKHYKKVDAYYEKAALLKQLKRYKEAFATYQQGIEISDNHNQLAELKRRSRKVSFAIIGQKIKLIVYALGVLNALAIPLILGISFQSWWLLGFLGIEIAVSVWAFNCINKDDNLLLGGVPIIVFGLGWVWISWLHSPSIGFAIFGFVIGFIVNLLVYAFIIIYGFNYLFTILSDKRLNSPPI